MTNQEKVREFLVKHGKELPNKPCIPSDQINSLILKLLQEELDELAAALFDGDITEVCDALGDIEVVLHNASLYCGVISQPIFDEIHRSNMTKDGTIRQDGKILKGASYEPPNLGPIIEEQMK